VGTQESLETLSFQQIGERQTGGKESTGWILSEQKMPESGIGIPTIDHT
jgi:hypothetical protein